MGNPVLRQRAEPVVDPSAPEIKALLDDMAATMEAADGVGLAAPQISVSRRVIMFYAPAEDGSQGGADVVPNAEDEWDERPESEAIKARSVTVLINPEIEPLTEERELGWEGCLSVPGLIGLVPRFTRIRYSGISPEGRLIERLATGFHARVVQHEFDHLEGVLYPRRLTDLSMLIFESEAGRYSPAEPGEEDAV